MTANTDFCGVHFKLKQQHQQSSRSHSAIHSCTQKLVSTSIWPHKVNARRRRECGCVRVYAYGKTLRCGLHAMETKCLKEIFDWFRCTQKCTLRKIETIGLLRFWKLVQALSIQFHTIDQLILKIWRKSIFYKFFYSPTNVTFIVWVV